MDEPAPAARYDLFSLDGQKRFVWRYTDRGVALEPDALAVTRAGQWTRAAYADIDNVTLSSASVGRSAAMGQCVIMLRNGRRILVTSANANGTSDGSRDTDYRRFVRDFHQKLVETGTAKSIRFNSGFSQGRMTVLTISLIAFTALFVVLPLVLLLVTHELQTLWILLTGVLFVVPFYRMARVNQPAIYSPHTPPDLLP